MVATAQACNTVLKKIFPICIPQSARRNFTLISEDVFFDDLGKIDENLTVPTNFDGAFICWVLSDPNTDEELVRLTTFSLSQIEKLDQIPLATRGRAILKIIETVTGLEPGEYRHEAWLELGGIRDTIIDPSPFIIEDNGKEFALGPPTPGPTQPGPQTQQERHFLHTWSADGTSDTVTIPDSGMVDKIYNVDGDIEDIPSGGSWSGIFFPSAGRTETSFTIGAIGTLKAGTTIAINIFDRL